MVEGLIVHADRCRENLEAYGGIHNSQRVLLALTQAGASREDGYRLVQRNGMKTWDEGGLLIEHLKADADVRGFLSDAQIEACFDEAYHLKHVDTIFARVFGA
jgi:adenylosuccinate lyase